MITLTLPLWLQWLSPKPKLTLEQLREQLTIEGQHLIVEISQVETYSFLAWDNYRKLETLYWKLVGIAYQLVAGQQNHRNIEHLLTLAGFDGPMVAKIVEEKRNLLFKAWVDGCQPSHLDFEEFSRFHQIYVTLAVATGRDSTSAHCDGHRLLQERAEYLQKRICANAKSRCNELKERIKFIH